MGRAPCCDKANVKRGPWSPEEDAKLKEYIDKYGTGGNWIALPHKVGLKRCGKSCRLRWLNYLRPNIKHGEFSEEEDRIICNLFATIGSRWSIIAGQLPGRTDNDIKNYWNTKLKKKLLITSNMSQLSPQNCHKIKPNINNPITYPLSSPNIPLSYDHHHHQYHTNFRAFSRVQEHPISPTFTPLISSNSKTAPDGILSPFNYNNLDQKDCKNLIFGIRDHQGSCSTSSEGSTYTANHQNISPDNYSNSYQDFCFQSYLNSGVDEINQKFLFSTSDNHDFSLSSSSAAVANGCTFGDQNQLDYYGIEEIKQLISTNNVCNNISFFVDDQIKAEKL